MTTSTEPDDDALAHALHRSRVLEDAPEALIQRAIGVFQARPSPQAAPGLRRRLAALLSFDSATLAGGQALGLRAGADMGETRQLLFSAEGRDVDLRITPAADGRHWQVSGQVLGPDVSGTAELSVAGMQLQTAWNELAEFSFDGVPAGDCSLVLRSADWELVLPGIQTTERG